MGEISTRGTQISYQDQGSGLCLVLAHSFLCSGEMWEPLLPALAEGHRVVNVDLRGHGSSGRIEGDLTLYEMVEDVVAVLDHLGVERAVWCGLSIGGMIALRAALTHPERVGGLVLLSTHAGAEKGLARLKYRAMGLGTRLFGVRPFLPSVTALMFGPTARGRSTALVEEWRGRFAGADVPSLLAVLGTLLARDSVVDRLGEIEAPSLVMVGEEDETLPPAYAREIDAGLRDSRLVVLPGAGHLIALEQPERVAGEMLGFLQGQRAT